MESTQNKATRWVSSNASLKWHLEGETVQNIDPPRLFSWCANHYIWKTNTPKVYISLTYTQNYCNSTFFFSVWVFCTAWQCCHKGPPSPLKQTKRKVKNSWKIHMLHCFYVSKDHIQQWHYRQALIYISQPSKIQDPYPTKGKKKLLP